MYLKKLEIHGFKSFAQPTALDFLPPKSGRNSITAIVGPNGSGKSNITDAIRWVMGETSLKAIRGKKSEDVIFSGSESKGQLGAAEVTMVLDNSDVVTSGVVGAHGRAPLPPGGATIDVSQFPEITITRRLYRNGETEYLVNNNQARLLDIHLLLARLQFAEGAYSIVSQGMIDRLLTVGPSERKDFFDEACGIKEHQIKEHQASLKLARTEENIKQAETLLNEVEPRLKLLARQVKKLEKRQEVEIELTDAQEQYYGILYSKNKAEADEITGKLKIIDEQYRSAFKELENIQSELAELAELARGATRQDSFNELQHRHQEAVGKANELERQLAILAGQMQTEYREAGAQNVGWLENKLSELNGEKNKLGGELSKAKAEADAEERKKEDAQKSFQDLQVEQTQRKLKISRLQTDLLKDQSEQSYRELSGLTAVKSVLENKQRFGKVYGMVAELGEVNEENRLALEISAGGHLTSIVVEDEVVARKAIEYLRENRLGVATFLPLNKIQPRPVYGDTDSLLRQNGVIGKAIDLVRFNAKFQNIFSLVFGSTLVVDDLTIAEKVGIGRARMVTLEGDLIEFKGVMRGGYRKRAGAVGFSRGLALSAEARLTDIQAQINAEVHEVQEVEKAMESAKEKLMNAMVTAQGAKERARLLIEEQNKLEGELAKLNQELSILKSSPEEYGAQLKKLESEKVGLTKNIQEQKSISNKIAAEIEDFNKKEEEKKQRVFALQQQMQNKQLEVNNIVSQRSDLNIQFAKLETKQEDLAAEVVNDMKVSLLSIVERRPEVASSVGAYSNTPVQQLADTIQRLKYQLSLIGGIDAEVVEEYGKTKERYDFLTGQLTDLRGAMENLEEMIGELSELMKKKRAVAFKQIRKEFDRYFKILFNGGSAGLEEVYGEVAEEDPSESAPGPSPSSEGLRAAAEGGGEPSPSQWRGQGEDSPVSPSSRKEKILTGIEVMANPPGKKIKLLNALSGGERTLTSIALICAILHTNPSPFVVLDEVEAALDEANTMRFTKIMTELSTQSQFIVVTHNRVTMHAADALYGVVMGADGASKLLSVKIEDVPQYEDSSAQSGVDKN